MWQSRVRIVFLDKLSLNEDLKLHVASEKTHDIGDGAYLYIGNENSPDYKIVKHLKAESSREAA